MMRRSSLIRRPLTAHAADKRSRLTVGRLAYTFATAIHGKEPFTPKLRLSIQKRLPRNRLTRRRRLESTRLNPPIEVLAPTPCSRSKRPYGKPGKHTTPKNLRT